MFADHCISPRDSAKSVAEVSEALVEPPPKKQRVGSPMSQEDADQVCNAEHVKPEKVVTVMPKPVPSSEPSPSPSILKTGPNEEEKSEAESAFEELPDDSNTNDETPSQASGRRRSRRSAAAFATALNTLQTRASTRTRRTRSSVSDHASPIEMSSGPSVESEAPPDTSAVPAPKRLIEETYVEKSPLKAKPRRGRPPKSAAKDSSAKPKAKRGRPSRASIAAAAAEKSRQVATPGTRSRRGRPSMADHVSSVAKEPKRGRRTTSKFKENKSQATEETQIMRRGRPLKRTRAVEEGKPTFKRTRRPRSG